MYDRLKQWFDFEDQVRLHINTYTREQYGNPDGQEQVETFTATDCWKNIQRYFNRRNANTRGSKEKLRDLIKVAHYAQLAYDKLKAELDEPDVYHTKGDRLTRVYERGLD